MRCRQVGMLVVATWFVAVHGWGGTIAIRAGHLVDPAQGTSAADQTILVKDGTIAAVGQGVEVPEGTPLIDLSNSWVLPGLMDAHVHITFGQQPPLNVAAAYLAESSALRALRGLHNARGVLESGFTTIRDVGNEGDYASVDLRKAIERGWFTGPTIVTTGKIIAPFGGQLPGVPPEAGPFWHYEYLDADTPDEFRKAVRRNIYYGAQAIKLVCDSNAYHCSEAEVRAAVEEAHGAGIPVSVHVLADEAARAVIMAGVDSIEHGTMLSDAVLQLMKDHSVALVSTPFPAEHLAAMFPPGNPFGLDAQAMSAAGIDGLKSAHRLGVTLVFGTDVVLDLPGRTRADMMLDYLDVWAAAGIAPADALRAMTVAAADLLRVGKERGAIATGQAADIIATPEDPLAHIQALRKVYFVMKDGEVVRSVR